LREINEIIVNCTLLPTASSLKEFYEEFYNLYKKAVPRSKQFRLALKKISSARDTLPHQGVKLHFKSTQKSLQGLLGIFLTS